VLGGRRDRLRAQSSCTGREGHAVLRSRSEHSVPKSKTTKARFRPTLPRQGGGISAGTRAPRPNASRAQNRGLPGQSWFAKRWQDLQSCKPAEHRQVVDNVIILGGKKIDNPWQCLKSVRSSRDLGANPSRGVCQKLTSIALFATAGVALPRTGPQVPAQDCTAHPALTIQRRQGMDRRQPRGLGGRALALRPAVAGSATRRLGAASSRPWGAC